MGAAAHRAQCIKVNRGLLKEGHLPQIFQAKSIESALKRAEGFRRTGAYDWFRGQLHAWPLRPSLFRETTESFQDKVDKVNRFGHWIARTPGLEKLRQDRDLLLAVAQHYGLPTTLLDFTTDPRIAAYFAGAGTRQPGRKVPKWSCIYCLNAGEVRNRLASNPVRDRIRLIEPDVDDLWRLQAQKGVFLDLQITGPFVDHVLLDLLFPFAMIRFPFRGPLTGIDENDVIPARKSHLEYLLERYFQSEYLHQAEAFMRSHPELFGQPIGEEPDEAAEWIGEAGAFRAGALPSIHESWKLKAGKAWLQPEPESYATAPSRSFRLVLSAAGEEGALREHYESQFHELFRTIASARSLCLAFEFDNGHAGLARQLELIWDGMRRFPFSDGQITAALTNRILLATAVPRRKLFGEMTLVEFGADDGSYTFAHCALASLRAAFRPGLLDQLAVDARRRVEDDPSEVLRILIDPRRLFSFEPFIQLFAEQLVPTQARLTWGEGGEHYCYSFSPMRVQRFGLH
jgi:hypothetical protein